MGLLIRRDVPASRLKNREHLDVRQTKYSPDRQHDLVSLYPAAADSSYDLDPPGPIPDTLDPS